MSGRKRKILIVGCLLVVAVGLDPVGRFADRLKPTGNCYEHLEDIDIAKQYWALDNNKPEGTEVTFSDLVPRYLTKIPTCRGFGTYQVGKLGADPTCSHGGRWHHRQFFLNYATDDLVIGRHIYIEGISGNSPEGATVSRDAGTYLLKGVRRWPFLQSGRKVSVFGTLVRGSGGAGGELEIGTPQWEFCWRCDWGADACMNHLRQLDGAQQEWAVENRKMSTDRATMSDILPYIKSYKSLCPYPRCDSGGIYILGKLTQSPRCTRHEETLDNL